VTRPIVVVDTETNGLDPHHHVAIEVAWWNLATDERGTFIPQHNVAAVLAAAEIPALRINGYVDRIASAPQDDNWTAARKLWDQLRDATLAGSNPTFDAQMLAKMYGSLKAQAVAGSAPMYERPAPWHHRLWDLSAYAAGVLGLDELPGLARVCELLGIEPGDHTAEADVEATGSCFRQLQQIATRSAAGAA
jgi:DNA polymerase-3 subunit epsilon